MSVRHECESKGFEDNGGLGRMWFTAPLGTTCLVFVGAFLGAWTSGS